MADPNAYFNVVLDLVKSAGNILAEGFSKTKRIDTKSASYDLVTEYDTRIEEILIKQISAKFPTHKFIGEETASNVELTDDPTWIIDPIDGTTNFVHGYADCCISVALAVRKQLEIGIIYSPIKNQLFTAQRGKGAKLNGKPIHVTNCTDVIQSLVAFEISLASIPLIRQKVQNRLLALIPEVQGIRCIGTCALTLCYVALGSYDAYQVDHLYPWDYSAGALIVQEAGGVVISTDGSPFEIMKRSVLAASSKQLSDKLVTLIKKADVQENGVHKKADVQENGVHKKADVHQNGVH